MCPGMSRRGKDSMNWKALKSGSDIRGYGIGEETNPLYLSDDTIRRITRGFGRWLSNNLNKECSDITVSVGHDSRVSAERIKKAVISALIESGVRVLDCGLSSTPAMFMTTVDLDCNGAVQITASHHPWDRNGLKFFTRLGGLEGAQIEEILAMASDEEDDSSLAEVQGSVDSVDYMSTYASALRERICREVNDTDYFRPLRSFKIVVDAGNGVGGFYASKVLEPLGADVSGSQFLEPDGTFPNHIPNPENKDAMASVCAAVEAHEADFGIIFDTDVDRAGCVGKGGYEINRNRLVALAAAICLEDNEDAVIVTDSITSDGLTEFIESRSGKHLRYMRGYKNVINKQVELTESGVNCPLAIETSGHAAFLENYFLDDGAYLVTKIIIEMAKLGRQGLSIEDLIADLREPLEEAELRFPINAADFKSCGEAVIRAVDELAQKTSGWTKATTNYEGIRVSADEFSGSGWFLMRLSVHDPVLVLNAESDVHGGVTDMLKPLSDALKAFDTLDLSAFAERNIK